MLPISGVLFRKKIKAQPGGWKEVDGKRERGKVIAQAIFRAPKRGGREGEMGFRG